MGSKATLLKAMIMPIKQSKILLYVNIYTAVCKMQSKFLTIKNNNCVVYAYFYSFALLVSALL